MCVYKIFMQLTNHVFLYQNGESASNLIKPIFRNLAIKLTQNTI